MKIKHFINSQKGITFIFVLVLMGLYHRWDNPAVWVYLALHGGYGILWNLKSLNFPDPAWEQPTSLWFGLVAWLSLCLYWIAPWLLIARNGQAPGWLLSCSVFIYLLGIYFHFTSDMQKYICLNLRPGQLITGGLWSLCRNPNYFGELLIYFSFALLALHWVPFIVLAAWVIFYWLPRMVKKDKVLAKLPGFASYQEKTRLFIPFLF
jgi:steroid 5-alpha reductase family enzyme